MKAIDFCIRETLGSNDKFVLETKRPFYDYDLDRDLFKNTDYTKPMTREELKLMADYINNFLANTY
jgi:hypothetical protein